MKGNEQGVMRNDDAARQLDRLVDGELSESDRRDLLLELDRQPEGWRQCALAFLESQCWKKELGVMLGPSSFGAADSRDAPPRRRRTWPQRLVTPLSMAASFCVALFLGTQLRQHGMDGLGRTEFTQNLVGTPIGGANHSSPTQAPSEFGPAGSGWQLVTVNGPDGPDGSRQMIRIPAVERDKLDERWLQDASIAMPGEVQRVLERTGHEVKQHRELLPLEMQDGRRLVVPVDQVEIHFVGRPAL